MKHTIAIILAAMVLWGCTVAAMADQFTVQVPLSVGVSEMFGFLLEKYSHDFGLLIPGSGAQTTIGIFCKSNHGVVWYMAVNANQFENGTGDIIPSNPNFTMAPWTWADPASEEAQGTFYLVGVPVPTVQTDFYMSTLAEGTDPFVPLTLGLYLNIPLSQPSGFYSTNLVLTMHE